MSLPTRVLYLTLFEKNLVRSYLLSDDGILIRNLMSCYRIVIITNSELFDVVNQSIKNNWNSNLSIITFDNFKTNFIVRLAQTFMRFMPRNRVTLMMIHRQFSLDKKGIKKSCKLVIYYFSKFRFFRRLVRLAYSLATTQESVKKCLSEIPLFSKNCTLFVTSLAPLRGEDTAIAVLFKKNNVPMLGTIRSWDNLSVDGILRILPDKFLYQSEFILKQATTFQDIGEEQLVQSVTPAYRKEFLPSSISASRSQCHFAYMCMGLTTNPDELNFIEWLIDKWKVFPKHYNLYIVQHPAFLIDMSKFDLPINVKELVFEFNSTPLRAYYSFLSNMDLVFGGGTTAILDASFVKTRVLIVKFEIITQNFWQSALRYHDYFYHTHDFFKNTNIPTVDNVENFIHTLLNHESIAKLDYRKVIEFIGNSELSYSKIIKSSVDMLQNN